MSVLDELQKEKKIAHWRQSGAFEFAVVVFDGYYRLFYFVVVPPNVRLKHIRGVQSEAAVFCLRGDESPPEVKQSIEAVLNAMKAKHSNNSPIN